MATLGSYLSGLRTARGVSLEEMARATRVSQRYLEALETDDHSELPAPVFTRGFVRAYCQTLEEPCEEALRRYAEQRGEKPVVAHRIDAVRAVDRNGGARSAVFISLVLLAVLGVALFVLTFVLQGGSRQASVSRTPTEAKPAPSPAAGDPSRGAPRVAEPAGATSAVAAAPPAVSTGPQAPAPTQAASPPLAAATAAPPSPYRLVARATEKTWVRVTTEDGRPVAEEVIPAGERREWLSNRRFIVTVGNAGGVDLELNGQLLPRLGPSGEVVRQLLIPAGER
jgi:cytoskeleton protein RodZ